MPYIEIERHRRRGPHEFMSIMAVIGDNGDYATDLAGQPVRERFSAPRIYRRMMLDEDFKPEHEASHHCSAAYAITRMDRGRPGTFEISDTGMFKDFHGGPGVIPSAVRTWFTDEALTRGVGWTFIQRYYLGSQLLGSFWVTRIIRAQGSSGYNVEVLKRRV